jgi:3-hydroxyacyl-CoA dehydrogenase / enoyl-CoA hydratase / 3-hydroxybutyryl-CoA epimerase
MTATFQSTLRPDGITWVTIDRAGEKMNTLAKSVIAELNQLLDHFDANPPKAVVFASGKKTGFIAGADITEFTEFKDDAALKALVKNGYDVFDRLAAVKYPTLALIEGVCLGGGMEFGLACRYRVAVDTPATKMALPEVMLGIVPGWGGMKRLPGLVGLPAALDMMLTGKTIDARRAKKMGLVNESVPVRIAENTAIGVITALPAAQKLPLMERIMMAAPMRGIVLNKARAQVAKKAREAHYPAPYAILDMVSKYGGNPFGAQDSDPHSLVSLVNHPTTGNLIRVFGLQERLKSLGKVSNFEAKHVHVVGAGVMGGDIAAWCALRGLTVTLQDQSAERLVPAMGRAAKLFSEKLRDPRRARDAQDRLIADVAGDGVARADVIIEAIFENLEAKQSLFKALEAKAKPGCILASNTSSIPLEQIASVMKDSTRLVGIHFFNPVPKMMLVEIVKGANTQQAIVDASTAFTKQIDKLPLPVKSAPGFLVNRVLAPYMLEAMKCVEEGIAPETIDEAALAFGMPMGPIELVDTVGLDVAYAVGKEVAPQVAPPAKLKTLVDEKNLGKKTGKGYYAWVDGKPQKQPAGAAPAGLGERLVRPYLEEAKRALGEGVVADADLLDAGAIFATGFAPFRGGPMHYQAKLAA